MPLTVPHSLYLLDHLTDDGFAMLESEQGQSLQVPTAWLPRNAQGGDVLRLELLPNTESSSLSFTVHKNKAEEAIERSLMQSDAPPLFE